MRRGALLLTGALLWTSAIRVAGDTEAVQAPAKAPVAEQSQDTNYGSRKSEGFVTLWLHPRWRDSVLIVAVTVFSHAGQIVTRSQLHEQTRLFVDGLQVAPARVEPWHLDATALVFRLPRPPKHFKIVIRDVPDVPTRVLTW